jgi:hypothetical protein
VQPCQDTEDDCQLYAQEFNDIAEGESSYMRGHHRNKNVPSIQKAVAKQQQIIDPVRQYSIP